MLRSLEPHQRAWREQLLADIHTAFASVRLGPGMITWQESIVIDNYGSDAQRAAARRMDIDLHWSRLVTDPQWHPCTLLGGFTFINGPSLRYYVPPTMCRFLHSVPLADVTPKDRGRHNALMTSLDAGRFASILTGLLPPSWSSAQRECTARFLWFMERCSDNSFFLHRSHNPWKVALNAGWKDFLPPQ